MFQNARRLNLHQLEERTTPSAFMIGTETQANTYTTNSQTRVATAMDTDGDFVVVWQSYLQDGSSNGIYARKYAADGTPTTPEFRVNTTTLSFQSEPDVAMDSDGDFVVVWMGGAFSTIYAQRYSAAGATVGSEFVVNPSGTGGQPEVAMGSGGNFAVVWPTVSVPGGLACRRYDAIGSALDATPISVATIATGPTTVPFDVAADSAGSLVVTWHGQEFGMSPAIYARQIPTTGLPSVAEFRVNALTTYSVAQPSVAVDSDGDFAIAWQYNGLEGGSIYARKYTSTTSPIVAEFKVNEFSDRTEIVPRIAMDVDGDFVVTYSEIGAPIGSGYDIYARCYSAAASPDGGEFLVNTLTTFTQYESVISSDADGDLVIAWPTNAISSGNNEIAFQRLAKNARVAGVTVNGGAVQRSRVLSMEVTFNCVVTITSGAFSVARISGGAVGSVAVATSTVDGRTVATLTFSGAETEFTSLVDGRYTLTIDATKVSDPTGGALDGNGDGIDGGDYVLVGSPANGVFRLYGDADGDGTVTSGDLLAFRVAFLSSSVVFDVDGDGSVDADDFLRFRVNYLKTV